MLHRETAPCESDWVDGRMKWENKKHINYEYAWMLIRLDFNAYQDEKNSWKFNGVSAVRHVSPNVEYSLTIFIDIRFFLHWTCFLYMLNMRWDRFVTNHTNENVNLMTNSNQKNTFSQDTSSSILWSYNEDIRKQQITRFKWAFFACLILDFFFFPSSSSKIEIFFLLFLTNHYLLSTIEIATLIDLPSTVWIRCEIPQMSALMDVLCKATVPVGCQSVPNLASFAIYLNDALPPAKTIFVIILHPIHHLYTIMIRPSYIYLALDEITVSTPVLYRAS